MKNIISKYINIDKPKKKLTEGIALEEKPVYMNTWKNYNEYGADLEAYGIQDGWMSIDDAIAFCEKYAEDEPFINDTDGVPFEISEYDNAIDKLNQLKKIEEADVDSDILTAFIEEERYSNIDDIIEKIESGDYTFFPGVDNDEALGEAYVNMCGDISTAVPKDRLRNFIDEDSLNDSFEAEGGERLDDATLDEYINNMIDSGSTDFLEDYFDYESLGRDLSFEYTYTSTGALCSN